MSPNFDIINLFDESDRPGHYMFPGGCASQFCPKVCDHCKAQYISKESSSGPAAAAAVPDAFTSTLCLGIDGNFCSGECRMSSGLKRQATSLRQKQQQRRMDKLNAMQSKCCAKKPSIFCPKSKSLQL